MEKDTKSYGASLNPTIEDEEAELGKGSILTEPKDTYLFNYFMFLLFGIVLILPFNALIQSIGFLEANIPGRDIEFVVSTLTNVPIFTGQILMLLLSKIFNIKATIIVSLVAMAGFCISIPFLTEYITNVNTLWIVIIIVIALFCLFNGISQCWAFGYAGIFPQRIISSLTNGTGSSGVVIAVLRAISLASFPIDSNLPRDPNLFTGAILHFSVSSALCLILTGLIFISYKTKYVSFYSEENKDSESQKRINSITNLMKSHQSFAGAIESKRNLERQSQKSTGEKTGEEPSMVKIHNENWINLWGILTNFAITFVMFPGLFLQPDLTFIDDPDWSIWFVIFVFTIFDTFGRVLAGFITLKSPIFWGALTILRFGNIAIAFLSAYDISFFGSDFVIILNVIVSAFGLGYLLTSQIIMAWIFPKPHEMEMAGKMVNIFLQLGIVIGSLIATFGVSPLF